MLKDLSLSEEIMSRYSDIVGKESKKYGGVEGIFTVLNQSFWPIQNNVKCKFPKVIGSMQEDFNMYYKN